VEEYGNSVGGASTAGSVWVGDASSPLLCPFLGVGKGRESEAASSLLSGVWKSHGRQGAVGTTPHPSVEMEAVNPVFE